MKGPRSQTVKGPRSQTVKGPRSQTVKGLDKTRLVLSMDVMRNAYNVHSERGCRNTVHYTVVTRSVLCI